MAQRTSVLVVVAEPDQRVSTRTLQVVVGELAARPDTQVTVWFLRPGVVAPWWPEAFVVDDLRRWGPARGLERLGLRRPAAHLRGARLRAAVRAVRPDVVLLDDGLGARAVGDTSAQVVVRRNAADPPNLALEEVRPARPDLVVGVREDSGDVPWLAMGDLVDASAVVAAAADARPGARQALGLADDDVLVVGWGGDGWVDGSDVFVRLLWHLEHRHGLAAHGLWLRSGDEAEQVGRLEAEAERCGVADRLHLDVDRHDGVRWAGDAVFLPYRAHAEVHDLLEAVAAGLEVVVFDPAGVDDPAVRSVGPLDLDAAAAAVVDVRSGDRDAQARAAAARVGVERWVDDLLVALGRRP